MDPRSKGLGCGVGAVRRWVVGASGRSVVRFMKCVWNGRFVR